jgi:NADH-quinone oxidoreductase subunit M
MSLMGGFAAFRTITIISVLGIIITTGYFLYMIQRVLLGPPNNAWSGIRDINKRELFTLVPLMVVVIAIGVYPLVILNYQSAAITNLIQHIGGLLL